MYHNGTYSVFDIDSLEFRILGSDDILFEFYLSLSRMYGIEHIPQKSQFILEYELPNEIFGERVKNRTQHLLERYDTVE